MVGKEGAVGRHAQRDVSDLLLTTYYGYATTYQDVGDGLDQLCSVR